MSRITTKIESAVLLGNTPKTTHLNWSFKIRACDAQDQQAPNGHANEQCLHKTGVVDE